MAGTNGGARPGAGRKSKAEQHKGAITRAEKRIADRLPELIDNMFALAEGVAVQEVDDKGQVKVFTRPPDRQANEYLINRIMGKPTERLEQSGPEGSAIPLQVFASDLKRAYGDDDGSADAPESR
jgi:hypothetical protein